MDDEKLVMLQVPARQIPVPAHLSPEAQAFLSRAQHWDANFPALDDDRGWRAYIDGEGEQIMQAIISGASTFDGTIHDLVEGEARAFDLKPAGTHPTDRRVYLQCHGGALILGAGEHCKAMGIIMAQMIGARVIAVDYRMPPEHPFPIGLDDCLAVYRALLRDHSPADIIVGGGSAGGNLAAAMVLRARDEGLPFPAAVVLLSPEVDLTESGDTFHTNAGIDGMGSLMQINLLYAAGRDLTDPYVSPLFGDFTRGFPPTLITAGTRDVFLSNAVRLHRKLRAADIPAELHVLEASAHGNFARTAPEEAELDAEVRSFCAKAWNAI